MARGLGLRIGLGGKVKAARPWPHFEPSRSFAIGYERIGYENDLGTSQPAGRFELVAAGKGRSLGLSVHNDIFAFSRPTDVFRTGAIELAWGFEADGAETALSLGLKLWTGMVLYGGRSFDTRAEFDLGAEAGAAASTGLLYVGFRRGALRLEVGWDSEEIRDFFQNSVHALIGEPLVPVLRRPGRPFFSAQVYPDGDLY